LEGTKNAGALPLNDPVATGLSQLSCARNRPSLTEILLYRQILVQSTVKRYSPCKEDF